MMGFLAGLPGQIATLTTRLSSTWAAKLDSLRTGLTDARMGYLEKLNVTGNVASAADVAALASLDSPLLNVPIASGLSGNATVNFNLNVTGHSALDTVASTASSSYVNALSYTGEGVLEFCAHHAADSVGTSAQMEIVIDGVTVYSGSSAVASGLVNTRVPVGSIDTHSIYTFMTSGAVPFRTSLVIRHKTTGGGTSTTAYKYRKTA